MARRASSAVLAMRKTPIESRNLAPKPPCTPCAQDFSRCPSTIGRDFKNTNSRSVREGEPFAILSPIYGHHFFDGRLTVVSLVRLKDLSD